jgi:transcriptional regulator with XRE-family HTH domain
MTSIRTVLAANIKSYRARLGLSQAKLAERMNITTDYVSRIESCKKFPSADMIDRLAAALEVDTPDLFAVIPLQKDWKKELLVDLDVFITEKIKNSHSGIRSETCAGS